jgi:dTDP-6-deoxy-L-talose 4-dehydrogenase (NAD+)
MSAHLRLAVTGASGFIGRHVVTDLLARGHKVVAAGRDPQKLSLLWPSIETVEVDVAAPKADDFKRLGEPDRLIHLAWGGLPNYRSLHHFETELPAQYRFLKSLVSQGLRSMVVTGTCFEYGLQSGALAENLPAAPVTVYGFAKDALRRQLEFLQASAPFELSWARLFYTYGPGQAGSSLWPLLSAAAARGDKTFDMSSGEQLRDYLPVEELASRLVALAARGKGAGLVNICAGKPISVRSLVEQWIAQNGWQIEPARGKIPLAPYEPMAFWGDDTYYRSLL